LFQTKQYLLPETDATAMELLAVTNEF